VARTELWLIRMPAGMPASAMQNAIDLAYLNASDDEIGRDTNRPQICGVWREPSSFCKCPRGGDTRKGGFTLGQKFGWWVHSACRKPTEYWNRTLGSGLFHVLGRNQLPDPPEEFKYEPRPSREMLTHVGVQLRIGEELREGGYRR
jgi:hypothetical protein